MSIRCMLFFTKSTQIPVAKNENDGFELDYFITRH
jgi:hypothetical protein